MKKQLYCLVLLLCFCNSLRAQWVDVDFTANLYSCRDIFFVDANKGFTVGDDGTYTRIYRTADGGTTWTKAFEIVDGADDYSLNSVFFANATLGFAAGSKGSAMFMCKTTDGGITWNIVLQSLPFTAAEILFTSPVTGYVCGNYNSGPSGFAKTADGGITWTDISQNASATLGGRSIQGIFFLTDSSGFAVTGSGGSGSGIYKTTDGGNSWVKKYQPGGTLGLDAIQFVDTAVGVACGSKGGVYKSTDGGETWNAVPIPITYSVTDVFFFTAQMGYAASGGLGPLGYDPAIYKTNDGGAYWNIENDGSPEVLGNYFALSFADGKGYASGWKGYSKLNNAPKKIHEIKSGEPLIKIYPNPGHGSYAIELGTEAKMFRLEVYDAPGNLVYKADCANTGAVQLDITALANGIYYVRTVIDEKSSIVSKISKL